MKNALTEQQYEHLVIMRAGARKIGIGMNHGTMYALLRRGYVTLQHEPQGGGMPTWSITPAGCDIMDRGGAER